MTTRIARIMWLTPEEGGRRVLPSGSRYIAPARFEGQAAGTDGTDGADWSLAVDLLSHLPGSSDWIAEVRYVVEGAPHELLRLGARFELYEGKKCVARGVIISSVPELEAEELTQLNNICADLLSLKRWEAFPLQLLTGKREAEWVRVRELCLQVGINAGDLNPDLFATWLSDTTGDEGCAIILFYDEGSMWSMAARYNRQRLLSKAPSASGQEAVRR